MRHSLNKKQLLQIHPISKYFEYLAAEYASGIKLHLSGPIKEKYNKSSISKTKGAKIYFKETVRSFLIGDPKILARDYLERNLFPKNISIKYRSLPQGVFRIMLNLRIQRIIQFMALTGEFTATDIAKQVNSLYNPRELFSPQVISKYLYFFWRLLPSEGDEPFDPIRRIQFLVSDMQLSEIYSDHIEVALGNLSPFEIAIKLGMDEKVSSQLNAEVYKGFAMTVARKNEAMMSNRLEEADTLSKIMSRDSQVLRNMGHKPKKKALRDQVNVVYADKD